MRRRLFNFAAAVSLVLFLATLVMWIRHRDYLLAGSKDGRMWQLWCSPVAIDLTTAPGWEHPAIWQFDVSGDGTWEFSKFTDGGSFSEFSLFGIDCQRDDSEVQVRKRFDRIDPVDPQVEWFIGYDRVPIRTVEIRYWILLAGILAAPVAWMIVFLTQRLRRSRRFRRGCCPTCGYNLTGNTSGVCPECGTPVADKAGVKG